MTKSERAPVPGDDAPSRRRSERFPVIIPVKVAWQEPSGNNLSENSQATVVNSHGGLLRMRTLPRVGSEVELINDLSSEVTQAHVVGIRQTKEGSVAGVAVELMVPSDTFWGVTFRLKRASAELHKLEDAIKSGNMDSRVLREFRDAVDHVRKTAWVVQEWQERQTQKRDAHTVLSLLTVERIRRAIQMTNDLSSDLDAREVTHETSGIADLFQAIDRVHKRLAALFGVRKVR